jgi:hypothetical protein
MSEAKDAFMFALDECLNRLDALAGQELAETEEDLQKRFAHHFHPNEDARIWVRYAVEGQRKRLNELEAGVWPQFRREDAATYMAVVERIGEEVRSRSTDKVFLRAVAEALAPLRDTIKNYAVNQDGVWWFREEDVDPVPPWNPPPAPLGS